MGLCEGDCDDDSDCQGNLVCYQRFTGRQPVPGCTGGELDNSKNDYCVERSAVNNDQTSGQGQDNAHGPAPLSNFRLKMYWQQGYYWQEETFERKWCMQCRVNGCSLGEKSISGNVEMIASVLILIFSVMTKY
ncbi:MAG TPA: hypothetical protein V6D48_12285 [Oculatellaceae cyanobacterium]